MSPPRYQAFGVATVAGFLPDHAADHVAGRLPVKHVMAKLFKAVFAVFNAHRELRGAQMQGLSFAGKAVILQRHVAGFVDVFNAHLEIYRLRCDGRNCPLALLETGPGLGSDPMGIFLPIPKDGLPGVVILTPLPIPKG